ncbi:ATP-binding cassette domain-containing protein [Eubacterium oxidoreducens]|uniref:ATP-binding cassette, subfamily F, member 3 n=1 Tax=Eubacterium oxidoreducens TaxID=1732 RepID=A0A1G6A4H3_EUBOX|nr:ATP-binding cassette domain-containing protein [Eubacterium oxidoreducens]SDB03337.1 ATP-binding cassette, subfamily F, member 3 [Eubacterium oxidoreducens]
MIRCDNVSFGYPTKELYEEINFEINTGEHIALIGSNGSGKSTLIDLIMHEEKYTYEGLIRRDGEYRIGYISQFVEHETKDADVFEFLAAPFVQLLKQSDELGIQMAKAEDMDAAYEAFQKVQDEIEAVDGYNYEANIRRQLGVAGLCELAQQKVSELSGGEYKLLFVMREMLLRPQLLIMDEPDVFLDFENLLALIKLINSYEQTLLIITHNRLLLTQCFDKILDIENKSIREFPGTFAEYNSWMLETKIEMFMHAKSFDEFLERQEEVVKRIQTAAEQTAMPKAGRQLKARASYIARLKKMRGEDPYIERPEHEFHLAFDKDKEPIAITMTDYGLSYGKKQILKDVSFTIEPGEKVALVGVNGTGKSSLLRDVYEKMEKEYPTAIGYFKQIVESDHTLGLSGGERNLKQIDTLIEHPHEALLLDEPTSHLDIYAQIALEKAIREYPGTVLMVSHDLFAVTGCADRIFLIEDNTIREMSGRAYRKSIYKKYFASDIFETERLRIDKEMKVKGLIRAGKYEEAKNALLTNQKDEVK